MSNETESNQTTAEKLRYRLKRNEEVRRKQSVGTASIYVGSLLIFLVTFFLVDEYVEFGLLLESTYYPAFTLLILLGVGLVIFGLLVYRHYKGKFEQFRKEYLKDGTIAPN